MANKIAMEPAFAWWVPYVLKHRNRIIAKVKSKYWERSHKFGIKVPKSVKEALRIDEENGDTQWRDAINKEMKNIRSAFRVWDDSVDNIPKHYQKINCQKE